ncbi:MAG: type II/IV secretion system ATPase subunit [Candidatus Nanoarchaeia archaeon]|nr:type II/IV secretion system ATPase subunit [Candidatus Nanoarchaeia archaeon]
MFDKSSKREVGSIQEAPKEETLFKIEGQNEIPTLPEFKTKEETDIRYALIAPYAYAHIHWDQEKQEVIYEVEEPKLDSKEKEILKILEDGVKELINISFISIKEGDTVIRYLEKNIKILLKELGFSLSKDTFLKVMYYIYRDFVGLNEIEPLISDYFIEDIECNGIQSPIYIVHRKYRNIKTNIVFDNVPYLASFVEKLAQKCGRYVSYASPLLDGTLPNGFRINATYTADISSKGPTFTIRQFSKSPWSPPKMIELGTLSPEILAYLWMLVEHEFNVMVIGGTGSGKTTLLNVLAFFIPQQARVVSIEDTRELAIEHENWLPSVAREGVGLANMVGQKYGEVTLFDLLKESFRQRPDYVIVGEVRGKEAFVLFQGMASGHPSMGTMHANDVQTLIRRLETPPIELSPSLVESMDAVCIMSQAKINGKEVRRLKQVVEIISVPEETGQAQVNVLANWEPRTDTFYFKTDSYIFEKLTTQYGFTKEQLNLEFENRTRLLYELYKRKIFDYKKVQEVINEYARSPKKILKDYGIIQ